MALKNDPYHFRQLYQKGEYNPWSSNETKLLIQLLTEKINNNWRDSNGLLSKLTVETKLLPELNKDVCHPKDYKNYQSRMKYLKQQYQSCTDLQCYSSGFGWDPSTKRFTASDEVWNAYIKVRVYFYFHYYYAIKEILDLEPRIVYKALTSIYHLGIQDVFVSMSVEERLGWIHANME
ncbi:hypothetical protein N665_0089s0031 [Sinapis alba]|nr:hypothetical protein N665_0089s0031 [Sinapis alba]